MKELGLRRLFHLPQRVQHIAGRAEYALIGAPGQHASISCWKATRASCILHAAPGAEIHGESHQLSNMPADPPPHRSHSGSNEAEGCRSCTPGNSRLDDFRLDLRQVGGSTSETHTRSSTRISAHATRAWIGELFSSGDSHLAFDNGLISHLLRLLQQRIHSLNPWQLNPFLSR